VASKEEIASFIKASFPHGKMTVEEVGNRSATVRQKIGVTELRPGGTVAGPVLMGVADAALYVALLGEIGIVPLAVTTNLNVNFLRKPSASSDVIAVCKLMKVGKLLATGEVYLYSDGQDDPVAHAVGTYAIPPKT
jgi:acyl-coenzyme A thioesterase PaaI-like protein